MGWLPLEPSVTGGLVVVDDGLRGIFLRFFLFFFPRFSKPSFSSVGGVGVKTNCPVKVNFLVKLFYFQIAFQHLYLFKLIWSNWWCRLFGDNEGVLESDSGGLYRFRRGRCRRI